MPFIDLELLLKEHVRNAIREEKRRVVRESVGAIPGVKEVEAAQQGLREIRQTAKDTVEHLEDVRDTTKEVVEHLPAIDRGHRAARAAFRYLRSRKK